MVFPNGLVRDELIELTPTVLAIIVIVTSVFAIVRVIVDRILT